MTNFDNRVDRTGTGAAKWDFAPKHITSAGHVPLTIADMEFRTAPAIIRAVERGASHGVFGYTYPDDEYFNALKGFMKRHHDWDVEREWLHTTAGVVQALRICVAAYTSAGDSAIIQPPVYPPFRSAVLDAGRNLLENPLINNDGHYEIDFDDLERKCADPTAKLLILCSPHNPVGRVWTRRELAAMNEIALRHGVTILSDEIHGELILPGYKHTTLATIEEAKENCVICTAMSKTFNLAGMACSNIFIPNEALRTRFADAAKTMGSFGVPALSRYAAIAAFTESDDWLRDLLEYINGNFEYLYDFISARLPMLKCTRCEGTYLAWVDMRALGLDDAALEDMNINKALLALDEGYIFGANGSGFERINLAIPRSELKAALERLESAIKSL
ncbi:MAG: MalY/PatB family protein [Clostridia bacterium]|nr:MalY/PatB family protein [Clostridia bacterium]